MSLQVGTKVAQSKDGYLYRGVVEQVNDKRKDQYHVRWHKGLASWESDDTIFELRNAIPEGHAK